VYGVVWCGEGVNGHDKAPAHAIHNQLHVIVLSQLALSCVPADEIQDRSARSTQRGTAPNTGRASTFSTPRHDATSLDMRRAMMFNDSDDDDDSADRIVRAASQRLQLGRCMSCI